MKTYASCAAALAQVVGAAGILHVLFTPPPTSAKVAVPDQPVQRAWAPPSWFPEASADALWVLPELDGPNRHERGPRVRARAAIIADLDTGEVLWSQRADEALPVASLTKTTAALALASTAPSLDATYCVTPDYWPSQRGARSKFHTGSCHDGWSYLGAALVASDNRGAMGLAAMSGLDYSAFIDRMDSVSAELGMHATWADPAGLEDENLATARDMLKAIVGVSAHPDLSVAASARYWTLDRDGQQRRLNTTNKLIDRWEPLAAKTGYTSTARYCFSQVVQTRSGRRLATVVLGSPTRNSRFRDTALLVEWAERLEG